MSIPGVILGSKGFFHIWAEQPYYDSSLDYPIRKTFALIELLDGSVKLLDPETIRFIEPYKRVL